MHAQYFALINLNLLTIQFCGKASFSLLLILLAGHGVKAGWVQTSHHDGLLSSASSLRSHSETETVYNMTDANKIHFPIIFIALAIWQLIGVPGAANAELCHPDMGWREFYAELLRCETTDIGQ